MPRAVGGDRAPMRELRRTREGERGWEERMERQKEKKAEIETQRRMGRWQRQRGGREAERER